MKKRGLDNAWNDLQAGKTIRANGYTISFGIGNIIWDGYGSSAEPQTKEGLRFIMNDIAKTDEYQYEVVRWYEVTARMPLIFGKGKQLWQTGCLAATAKEAADTIRHRINHPITGIVNVKRLKE